MRLTTYSNTMGTSVTGERSPAANFDSAGSHAAQCAALIAPYAVCKDCLAGRRENDRKEKPACAGLCSHYDLVENTQHGDKADCENYRAQERDSQNVNNSVRKSRPEE